MVYRPNDFIRTDGYGHLPEHGGKGRCRYCRDGTSRMKCVKCKVALCFNQNRNCFAQFHITKKGHLVPKGKEKMATRKKKRMREKEKTMLMVIWNTSLYRIDPLYLFVTSIQLLGTFWLTSVKVYLVSLCFQCLLYALFLSKQNNLVQVVHLAF